MGTTFNSRQIRDGSVSRDDLNITTAGQAVIRKIITGAGLSQSYTGADSGTGDVTLSVSGVSGVDFNAVTNPTAETDASSWTNGTQISVARTTTSGEVLQGSGSLKISATSSVASGAYVYASCSPLPLALRSGPVGLEFDFKGLTGYDSGDCQVVLYDGTTEIIPSATSVPGESGHFMATFVATSSSSAYQVRFKSTVSSSAWDLSVDNLYVGPVRVQQGVPMSDLVDHGASVLTATTTNPSKGTMTTDKIYSQIIGDMLHVYGVFDQSSAGSAGSGSYLIEIPNGKAVDTTKLNIANGRTAVGSFEISDTGASSTTGTVTIYDSTHLQFHLSTGDHWGSAAYSLANTNMEMAFEAMFPVVGHSSSAILVDAKIAYASNSSTNDGNDTTTFADGPLGSTIPALTGTYKKRIRCPFPISQLAKIEIEADWDNQGKWDIWHFFHDNADGTFGPSWEYVSSSSTDIDVWMRGDTICRRRVSDATNRTYTQENSAGSKWRVKFYSTPNAIESPHLVEEVEVSYVTAGDGGTATSGSENDCSLNTINNSKGYGWITGPSSNAITLTSGTYSFVARQNFYNTGATMFFIKNTTDSSYIASGTGYMTIASNVGGDIVITGTAVLTGTKTIKLRYEVQSTQSGNGLGADAAMTNDNVFTHLKIQRLGP